MAQDELGANVVVSSKSSLFSLAVKLGDVKDSREQTWVERAHTLWRRFLRPKLGQTRTID